MAFSAISQVLTIHFFFFLPTTYQSYLFHFIKCGWKKVTNLHFSLKSSAIMKGQVFDAFAWLKQNIPPWLRQEKRQSRPIVLQWLNTTKKKKKKKKKNYWFLFPHGFRQQDMSGFPIGSITHKSECVHFSLMD